MNHKNEFLAYTFENGLQLKLGFADQAHSLNKQSVRHHIDAQTLCLNCITDTFILSSAGN